MGMMGGMGGMGMPGGLGMPAAATGGLGATQVICLANMLSIEELASDEYDEVANNHPSFHQMPLQPQSVIPTTHMSSTPSPILSLCLIGAVCFVLKLSVLCRRSFLILKTSVRRLVRSRNFSSPDQLPMVQLCLESARHLSSSQIHCQHKRSLCIHTTLHCCSCLFVFGIAGNHITHWQDL